jgi:multicomponent K+:H+ antiporter subunit A
MMLVAAVLLPFAAALVLLAMPNHSRTGTAWVAAAFAGASALALASCAPAVFSGEIVRAGWDWLPFEGARFGFRADGFAWMFAALVVAIGLLVILYARYYLAPEEPFARFFAFFMLFMGAMLGLVLADNLLLLVVFWELTSLASFLLIGFWQGEADARQGARMALTITGAGGLALLAGVLLIGKIVGTFDLDAVLAAGDVLRADPGYPLVLALVLAGAFTKSAQVPFSFWLPQAMAAPTPVSAYLHSATMVKAGVFLIARLHPALSGTELWFWAVGGIGLFTLVAGAYIAIFQHDLKGLLAYSTVSHLGLITLLFGLSSPLATVAGVFHILNHATFKASLFMAAGIIDHETGTRDMRRLAGLWKAMRVTAILAIVAAASMAGVPLLNGFLSKEMFFAETLGLGEYGIARIGVPALATIAGAFAVAYSLRFIHDVFWNGECRIEPAPHDPPFWMIVPVGILVLLCVLVGVLPQVAIGPLLDTAARPVVGGPMPEYTLAVWHGVNLPLLMSALALGAGVTFYFSLQRIFRLHDHVHLPRGGKEIYDTAVFGLFRVSGAIMRRLAGGGLQRSLAFAVAAALVAGAVPFLADGFTASATRATPADALTITVWAIGILATIGVVILHRRRLAALVVLGAVGLAVSLAFVGLSAPDLALTQLLVEFVSIVLILLALHYLPERSASEFGPARRTLHAALALGGGGGLGLLAWFVMTRDTTSIAPWFLENALPRAFGSNVVNVILVDFRAFDTLGEITVLALAGLAIHGLLHGVRALPAHRAQENVPRSPLLSIVSLVMLPLAITVSLFLFWRGHNLPGGGFIAGLVFAVALLVPYLAFGASWVESKLRLDYHRAIGFGLLAAGLTGVGSFFAGHPFLTSTYWKPIASALFFDLGVYLVVVGATMLTMSRLGRVGTEAAR